MNATNPDNTLSQCRNDLIQRFYEAIFSLDWADVQRCVTDDLTIVEAEGLPYGGTYTGVDELKSLFERLTGYWENLDIARLGLTFGSENVVGMLRFSGRSKKTGIVVSMPMTEIFEFEGDLISKITPLYFDTKTLSEAIGE